MATLNTADCSLSARLTAWFSREQLRRFQTLSQARGVSQSAILRRAAELGLRLLEGACTEAASVDADALDGAAEGEVRPRAFEAASVDADALDGAAEGEVRPRAVEAYRPAEIPQWLDLGWQVLLRETDPIWLLNETPTCEPARTADLNLNLKPSAINVARAWDPAAQPRVKGGVAAVAVVAAWEQARPAIEARWAAANVVLGLAGYKRMPRPAILGEALRRRIAHASRSLRTLEDWQAAFAALAEVPPHAVNRLYLWELDRLCRIPLEANEQEALRALAPQDRPVFAERLTAYATWTGTKREPRTESTAPKPSVLTEPQKKTEAQKTQRKSMRTTNPQVACGATPPRYEFSVSQVVQILEASRAALERERAQREQAQREQAQREQAQREQAQREQAQREQESNSALERMRSLRSQLFGGRQ